MRMKKHDIDCDDTKYLSLIPPKYISFQVQLHSGGLKEYIFTRNEFSQFILQSDEIFFGRKQI